MNAEISMFVICVEFYLSIYLFIDIILSQYSKK